MADESRVTRARRFYAQLLRWCYPATFRHVVGAPATELFVDRYREALRRGSPAVFWFWFRTLANVARHGPMEHLTVWRERRPLAGFVREFLSACRLSHRSYRVTLAAVGCIALGVAATSAVLTLFSAVVIRPSPFPESDRLVRVWGANQSVLRNGRVQLSMADIRDIEPQLTTLDRFVATVRSRLIFLGPEGTRRVEGEAITPGYFDLLGVDPVVGRVFAEDEYGPGSEATMVLAHGTWIREFGGRPDIIGETVRTTGRTYTVLGVMPPTFYGTIEEDFPEIEFWVPVVHDRTAELHARRDIRTAWTVGRLSPGATLGAADREIGAIGQRLSRTHPGVWGPMGLYVEAFGENWRSELRQRNYLLLGAAILLLVIAAANVAGLLLARSLSRQREFAVRTALGAGRMTLLRQSMMESLVLVGLGGILGILAAPSMLDAFLSLAPEEIPTYVNLAVDRWALGIAVVCIGFATMVTGGLPAVVAARIQPGAALRSGARGTTVGRMERHSGTMVILGEVALTTMLVITAASLIRTYQELGNTELGFTSDHVLRMAVFLDGSDVESREALNPFYDRLSREIHAFPGVESVGLVSPTVPPGFGGDARIRFPDLPSDEAEHGLAVYVHAVDTAFFRTLEIPIVAGRSLRPTDGPSQQPVAIVSASLADLMGGPAATVGKTIQRDSVTFAVVGVAADVRYFGPVNRRPRDLDVYMPLAQAPGRTLSFAIKTAGDPATYIAPLRRLLGDLAPNSAVDWVSPLTQALETDFRGPRFYTVLVGAFAAIALLLMSVGLFAVLAFHVTQRKVEFGIRQALGADRRSILSAVLRHGFAVVGSGLAGGAVGSAVILRTLGSTVYGAGGLDFPAVIGTVAVIAIAAAVATAVPAARAARVSPLEALRGG